MIGPRWGPYGLGGPVCLVYAGLGRHGFLNGLIGASLEGASSETRDAQAYLFRRLYIKGQRILVRAGLRQVHLVLHHGPCG
jgi:hypothetical protein